MPFSSGAPALVARDSRCATESWSLDSPSHGSGRGTGHDWQSSAIATLRHSRQSVGTGQVRIEEAMIFVVDNYDSFTFNLVQYLGELGASLEVRRNDEVTVREIRALRPERILVSPGPCTPREAGISVELIQEMAGEVPILGVCLGHQSIGEAFGGNVIRAPSLMHGKTSLVKHDGRSIFAGLEQDFVATRYHSLIIERESLPQDLEISAWTDDGVIMGVRHRSLPVEGVQFHPESILTSCGKQLLANFLRQRYDD